MALGMSCHNYFNLLSWDQIAPYDPREEEPVPAFLGVLEITNKDRRDVTAIYHSRKQLHRWGQRSYPSLKKHEPSPLRQVSCASEEGQSKPDPISWDSLVLDMVDWSEDELDCEVQPYIRGSVEEMYGVKPVFDTEMELTEKELETSAEYRSPDSPEDDLMELCEDGTPGTTPCESDGDDYSRGQEEARINFLAEAIDDHLEENTDGDRENEVEEASIHLHRARDWLNSTLLPPGQHVEVVESPRESDLSTNYPELKNGSDFADKKIELLKAIVKQYEIRLFESSQFLKAAMANTMGIQSKLDSALDANRLLRADNEQLRAKNVTLELQVAEGSEDRAQLLRDCTCNPLFDR